MQKFVFEEGYYLSFDPNEIFLTFFRIKLYKGDFIPLEYNDFSSNSRYIPYKAGSGKIV